MIVRNPRDRHRTQFLVDGPSLTDTSHAEACDINFIVHRYARSGHLPPATREPFFGDVTQLQGDLSERLAWSHQVISDYQEALASAGSASQDGTTPPTEPPTGSPEPV